VPRRNYRHRAYRRRLINEDMSLPTLSPAQMAFNLVASGLAPATILEPSHLTHEQRGLAGGGVWTDDRTKPEDRRCRPSLSEPGESRA
jgi:hypothetical protein